MNDTEAVAGGSACSGGYLSPDDGRIDMGAACARFRQMLIDAGLDPDWTPEGHVQKLIRDTLIWGTHFDRQLDDGTLECIDNPEQIRVTLR